MIQGYFRDYLYDTDVPFLDVDLEFSSESEAVTVPMLIDTGANITVIGTQDAYQIARILGLDLASLPEGNPIGGIGGDASTRVANVVLRIGDFSGLIPITILEPPVGEIPPIPSLLGRDIISQFALLIDHRTQQILLLEDDEVDKLNL